MGGVRNVDHQSTRHILGSRGEECTYWAHEEFVWDHVAHSEITLGGAHYTVPKVINRFSKI